MESGKVSYRSEAMEQWSSRRSSVFSLKGMCSSSQPLATAAGVKILEQGGTAADAAVAMVRFVHKIVWL